MFKDDIHIQTIKYTAITDDCVIIVKVPYGKYDVEQVARIFDTIKLCFPDNRCMIIPDDIDIQFIQSTDDITPATRDELNEFLQIYNNTEGEWLNG